MKISKKGVELCGKVRKFKRTPKRQTIEHQKQIDSLFDDYQPILDESQRLQDELESIEEEIMDINEIISILKSKDTSESEYQKMMDLIEERKSLRAERRELGQKIRDFTNDHLKDFKDIEDDIPNNLAKLASQMVDITPEEFLEEYTEEDELMVRNLAFFKQMADAGNTDKQMEQLWSDIVKQNIESKRGITPTN